MNKVRQSYPMSPLRCLTDFLVLVLSDNLAKRKYRAYSYREEVADECREHLARVVVVVVDKESGS
jgi:hypothetical protein